jgi:hypothetical protein
MNYIAKWEEKKKDLPGSGDEDVMEDWLKLLSSPLPLFFVRFSSGLTFLCFVSFFFSCSPFLPQCLPSIVVLLVLFFGFLPFSSVSVLFMFFFPVLFYVGLSLLLVTRVLKEILRSLSSVSPCLCFFSLVRPCSLCTRSLSVFCFVFWISFLFFSPPPSLCHLFPPLFWGFFFCFFFLFCLFV